MSSVLEHYNPYTTNSQLQWQGLRSSKFGRTKVFLPKRDLITNGLNFPSQDPKRGRKHYQQTLSPEKQFRPIVRIIPKIQHWHPRQSHKKVFTQSFTQNHQRRQRGHQHPQFYNTDRSIAGIRTFYNTRIRDDNFKQYSVQDKMQRKVRVDQFQLRKTFFMKQKQIRNKFVL